ncbi:MAG: tRNA 2-thiouridine(34) synthase MnmA [Candidatus Pacebacteria bacterium]|mgnify:CR=1 FL=1|jgi:tRNA-specific 2-thiouridylase|nr:tRNA 2-thiouridine(34) synthase MnmA [Parcubacteria group bacterium]MDP6249364.1 tRNA 2-thiouridine(34) synthase MnmA [Candidatus Paceibacterota bacterium]MDP7159128.1 tRNA 2-thiouridine(34) synthase MnmA [Candidatus Paceibacterota bacterium]MDP7368079.1 tRNA 2-thiouridine(34) synthase MnmA [Candidatus Paceibacterota bacterium]MDP7466013.1 tRNA 2-thiouridine(34) synthase MnmA [Candidatus Paceibacterota bacterium]|tara:strand:+ start:8490 stop:9566 length:1077 start_codon:yes stop_codon:yes gene_type:complete
MNKIKGKKVFVALSGGVDSSVAAALLKKEGFDVTGVFIKVWHPDFLPCQWRQDRIDAMRVCAKLEIPFLTFDLEREYKKEIIDYMISEYREGRTPNPDVMCNKQIKFGAYLKKALSSGAEYIATGHYARKVEKDGEYKMLVGNDSNKDQSYFLWTLTQEQLRHSFFPTGEFTKPKVRELAEQFGLSTAKKKDSQGLCFIGKLDIADFLKNYIEEKKGDVLNEKGKVIGHHSGVTFLTIGQRHGFTIEDKGTHDKPYYIISKDISKNTITVSHDIESKEIDKKSIKTKDVNWISGKAPSKAMNYQARIRYRQELQDCTITWLSHSQVIVEFDESQDTATSGQSLVLYNGDECLGGGIII